MEKVIDYVSLIDVKIKVARMSCEKFEHYVADILKSDGYKVLKVTNYSCDYGADVIVEKEGVITAVQVKYTRLRILDLRPAVEQVVTSIAFYKCHDSMVVSNGQCHKQKMKIAEMNNCKIIAGDDFYALAEQHEKKCLKKMRSKRIKTKFIKND